MFFALPTFFSPTVTCSSPSRTFVVGILSTEPCVTLHQFSHHPVLPASFPPMMTRSSPSCTPVVGIPSNESCVSLDRFSYHPILPAFLPPMMTGNSPSCRFVVRIPSSESCVSLDWFFYNCVPYIADLLSYAALQVVLLWSEFYLLSLMSHKISSPTTMYGLPPFLLRQSQLSRL